MLVRARVCVFVCNSFFSFSFKTGSDAAQAGLELVM